MESTKDYKMQGLLGAALIHLALLLLLFFIVLGMPDPPFSERGGGGIELNYGTDAEGYGDVQTMNTPNPSPLAHESAPAEQTPQTQPEVTPVEATTPAPQDNNQVITSEDEGNEIKIKEQQEKKKQEEERKRAEQKKKEQEKKQQVNPAATYNPATNNTSNSNSNGKTGTDPRAGGNSNGDREGKTGDQGDPKGSLNSRALYGEGGSGGGSGGGHGTGTGKGNGPGASLNMAGWMWDSKPKVNDESDESGRIVFKIRINVDGEIESINAIEKSVSPSLVRKYQDEVEKLTFSKSSGQGATEGAVGYITFIIRSR